MDKIKPIFSATATATGGRNGVSKAEDGSVNVHLSVPKEMGGEGKANTTTPEHLFAAGYSACLGGAIDLVAKQHKKDASKAEIRCQVAIGPREGGGFGLAIRFNITDQHLSQADLAAIVREAHEKICPYSHATRGNVQVDFDIHGSK